MKTLGMYNELRIAFQSISGPSPLILPIPSGQVQAAAAVLRLTLLELFRDAKRLMLWHGSSTLVA